jgi:hypothetical protein
MAGIPAELLCCSAMRAFSTSGIATHIWSVARAGLIEIKMALMTLHASFGLGRRRVHD